MRPWADDEAPEPAQSVRVGGRRSKGTDGIGDEFETPDYILDLGRQVIGSFDLDPASNAHANERVQAEVFYTKEFDAPHLQSWHASRLWCNPPYSRGLIDAFVEKFLIETLSGHVQNGLFLTNAATDTEWAHALMFYWPVCFLKKRVSFLDPRTGKPKRGNQCGQMITCASYGDKVQARFVKVFGAVGRVMRRTA